MKNIDNAQKIFEALGEIDDEILQQAFSVDDKKAFDAVKNDGQQKSFVVFTSLKRVAAACLILAVAFLAVAVGVKWFSLDKEHNDGAMVESLLSQSQVNSEMEDSTEISAPEVVVDDTPSGKKPQTPSQSVDIVESSVSENSTASSSNSKAPSTNPQSSIADNINSVPGNNNTQNMPEENITVREFKFGSLDEFTSWLKNDSYKTVTNLSSFGAKLKDSGLFVPKTTIPLSHIMLYPSAVSYVFKNIDKIKSLGIQVFSLDDTEKAYLDKGIAKYYEEVKKTPINKVIEKEDDQGNAYTISYEKINLEINNKPTECIKIASTKYNGNSTVYQVFYDNYRFAISVSPYDIGDDAVLSVINQISFEHIAIK